MGEAPRGGSCSILMTVPPVHLPLLLAWQRAGQAEACREGGHGPALPGRPESLLPGSQGAVGPSFCNVRPKHFTLLPFKWGFSCCCSEGGLSLSPAPACVAVWLWDADLIDRWPLRNPFPVKNWCGEKHFPLSPAWPSSGRVLCASGSAEPGSPPLRGGLCVPAGLWEGGSPLATRRLHQRSTGGARGVFPGPPQPRSPGLCFLPALRQFLVWRPETQT